MAILLFQAYFAAIFCYYRNGKTRKIQEFYTWVIRLINQSAENGEMQRVKTKHDCLFRVFTIYNFLCAWFICTHRINRPISDIMSKLEPQPNQTNTFITFSQQRIGSALAFTQSGKGLQCKLLWQLKKQCALVWTATYLNKLFE